jgi:protein tyrosine phosphatase (PTP) superfamily phosphohydrolase (DUF442 family)
MRIKFVPEQFLLLVLPALALAGNSLRPPEGVHSYQDKIFISAAPTKEMFQEMSKLGVKAAVDLREPEELKGFEKSAAKENGIEYFSSPISRSGDIQESQIAEVEKIVAKRKMQKIWVYCASANRAASWMAIHLAKNHKMTPEEAIAEAKTLGLAKEEMATKVRAYLQSN